MKHFLSVVVGLFVMLLIFFVSWVITYHAQVLYLILGILIVLGIAYILGYKILEEFKR